MIFFQTIWIKYKSVALGTHVYIWAERYLIDRYHGAHTYDIILYVALVCGGKYAYVRKQYVNARVNQLSTSHVSRIVVTKAVFVYLLLFPGA